MVAADEGVVALGKTVAACFYLIETVDKVVLQKSIPPQIRHLILDYYKYEELVAGFVWNLSFTTRPMGAVAADEGEGTTERIHGLLPESHGHNLALIVCFLAYVRQGGWLPSCQR